MRAACCALLLLVTSLSLSPAIAEVVPGRGLGARPPTPAEQAYIDAVYTQTTDVAPNRLARAREDLERRAAVQRGELLPTADGLPSAVDNSTLQYFPPIRSQGSQGSCTAWASCYYYDTFTQAFDEGYDVSGGDNNHICSPAFLYPLINGGVDWGASTQYAMARLNDLGSSSWALKPYSASDWTSWPSEAAWVQALNNRTQEPHWIDGSTASGLDEIKQHLANGNLAVTDFWVYGTWYDYYPADRPGIDGDVYYAPDGDVLGGHAVTIVGYDDNRSYVDHRDEETHYGAFLVANSWGTWWGVPNSTGVGDAGFFWVAYDMFLAGTFGPLVCYNGAGTCGCAGASVTGTPTMSCTTPAAT
jgi:C1A family cysteine protease